MALPFVPPDPAGLLAADVDAGVLIRCLLVALVLVTPYFLYKRQQVRARRAEWAAATASPVDDGPDAPRLEDVVARIEELGSDLEPGASATLTVPVGVTIDGREVPAELADTLVRDALRRSGLAATAEVDTAAGRSIECRRR